jgi:DNA ligase-1
VSVRNFQFQFGAIHIPELGLWMDPHEPVLGPERVFISHAHSDHTAPHREVILTEPTSRLAQCRMGDCQWQEHALPFHRRTTFAWQGRDFGLTLLPAGHIFGSAMALIECDGASLLYTGDFKLRPGRSAEAYDLSTGRGVDILIMETTYGRPEYQFPPTDEVIRGTIRFCRESLDNDEIPVLLGYSLGKSQELLCGLAEAGLSIVLHPSVECLTKVYEQMGHRFPPYELLRPGQAAGKVLLFPPGSAGPGMLRGLGQTRTAVLTGWAVEPGCRFRYQTDAAFALSDHADFPDLIKFVQTLAPKQVFTLHGFAADFAATLRGLGFDARALSQDEQLTLPLTSDHRPGQSEPDRPGTPPRASSGKMSVETGEILPAEAFGNFAATCAAVAGTAGKLEKIQTLANFLRGLEGASLRAAATWFTGLPFASTENKVLKVGWTVIRDALSQVSGVTLNEFRQVYLKHSDLGETADELLRGRSVPPTLQISDVSQLFQAIHEARGTALKRGLLEAALSRSPALEAKYLVKIVTGDLRIGLKEGLVEEAIAAAFQIPPEEIRRANLLLGHIGEAAVLAKENSLHQVGLEPFRPVKFMLASPEATAEELWQRLQSGEPEPVAALKESPSPPSSAIHPVWLEDKYDGIRCQLHKVGSRVALYSRDLKEISATFPEIGDAVRNLSADVVIDGEILAMRGETVLPFADLQKRLGRREADLFMAEEVPIRFLAFDLLWVNGHSLLNEPLSSRRQQLEQISWPGLVRLAAVRVAHSAEEVEQAFDAARARQNEGLMAKDPNSPYTPGRRGLAWLKLKKALATLDCVVVGAEFGHGRRKDVLSDYTFAVRDAANGALKTIGKAYSGLTDDEIAKLTQHFLQTAVRRHGRYIEVVPDTVLEIAFDRIQPSARHTSGLALRFPRILRIRIDKTPEQIDTLESARRLAGLLHR